VIRESRRRPLGGDRRHASCCRTGSAVRITAAQGSTSIDRMIRLGKAPSGRRRRNEIALNILLAGLTIIFVFRNRPRSRAMPPMPAASISVVVLGGAVRDA